MDLYYGTSGTNSSFRNQEDREEKWEFSGMGYSPLI